MKVMCNEDGHAATCFFRSLPAPPHRKGLVQLTTSCNEQCTHCFMSATYSGPYMTQDLFQCRVVPALQRLGVVSVTLTGGEPTLHPLLLSFASHLRARNIRVGVCTNGIRITDALVRGLSQLGAHVNVSLHGFSPESHARITGAPIHFDRVLRNIRRLGEAGVLQGVLVTPHRWSTANEMRDLCAFSEDAGASYVLFNPLSPFGRGVSSEATHAAEADVMAAIRSMADSYERTVERVLIRLPNDDNLPLSSCKHDRLIYVFVNGDITTCPHLVFASQGPHSLHNPREFILANVETDSLPDAHTIRELVPALYFQREGHPVCASCGVRAACGFGCPAIAIAHGQRLSANPLDDLCPNHAASYRGENAAMLTIRGQAVPVR